MFSLKVAQLRTASFRVPLVCLWKLGTLARGFFSGHFPPGHKHWKSCLSRVSQVAVAQRNTECIYVLQQRQPWITILIYKGSDSKLFISSQEFLLKMILFLWHPYICAEGCWYSFFLSRQDIMCDCVLEKCYFFLQIYNFLMSDHHKAFKQ